MSLSTLDILVRVRRINYVADKLTNVENYITGQIAKHPDYNTEQLVNQRDALVAEIQENCRVVGLTEIDYEKSGA